MKNVIFLSLFLIFSFGVNFLHVNNAYAQDVVMCYLETIFNNNLEKPQLWFSGGSPINEGRAWAAMTGSFFDVSFTLHKKNNKLIIDVVDKTTSKTFNLESELSNKIPLKIRIPVNVEFADAKLITHIIVSCGKNL